MARGRRRPADNPDMEGNLSKPTFLEMYDLVREKLRLKKEADSALSNAYKACERSGIDTKELKGAMKKAELSAEERAIKARKQARYQQWLGLLPMEAPATNGHDPAPDPAEAEAVQKHENSEAYEWGVSAGKAGAAIESLPYTPGSEEYQQAHLGWSEGQRLAVESLGGATHRA